MFTLYDNRTELYQWDLNRKVIVSDDTVTEVHFCNKTDDCSLVVPTYRLADANILVADIPNILLQDNWNIRCYAYCTDYTKVEALFKVKPRTRPADYVYTETEVRTWNEFNERFTALENTPHAYVLNVAGLKTLDEIPVTEELKTFFNRFLDNQSVVIYLATSSFYYLGSISRETNNAGTSLTIHQNSLHMPNVKNEISSPYFSVSIIHYSDDTWRALYYDASDPVIVTKDMLDEAITNVETGGGVDLSNYYTKDEVYDKSYINVQLSSIRGKISDLEVAGYQTEEQVNTLINNALGVIENGTY